MQILDPSTLLLPREIDLLHSCASQPFKIGKFSSLDDILTSLKIKVIIEPGIHKHDVSFLNDIEEYWKNETDSCESLLGPGAEKSDIEKYRDAKDKRWKVHEEKEIMASMVLRGLYDPKELVIKLFPDAMRNGRRDELLVSTLAHETMHAYFDRPRKRRTYPYAYFVEEPLAEFGMLLYLYMTQSPYYLWAFEDVSHKKTCYHYGANLMFQCLAEGPSSPTRAYMEEYKICLDAHTLPDFSGTPITLPSASGQPSQPITIGGHTFQPQWNNQFKNPPRYYYDKATDTLCLDGEWGRSHRHRIACGKDKSLHVFFDFHIHSRDSSCPTLYLGDNFEVDPLFDIHDLDANVIVSPHHKQYTSINGILVDKQTNEPILDDLGPGLYRIQRGGKWGIVDAQLNIVVPCKYDDIWSFDKNGHAVVELNDKYGKIDTQGNVVEPCIHNDFNWLKQEM